MPRAARNRESADLNRRAAGRVEAGSGLREDARRFNRDRRDLILPDDLGRYCRPFAADLIEKDADFALVRAAERFAGVRCGVTVRVAVAGAVIVSQAFVGVAVLMAGREVVQSVAEHGNPAVDGHKTGGQQFSAEFSHGKGISRERCKCNLIADRSQLQNDGQGFFVLSYRLSREGWTHRPADGVGMK